MKPLTQFIIEPKEGRVFNNTTKIGDIEFITHTSEDDHLATNRIAVVIKTPFIYKGEIKEGTEIVVHHNTFRHHYDMQGNLVKSAFAFTNNQFLVRPDDLYLYKVDGKWKANDRYCFVKPVVAKEGFLRAGIKEEPLMGEVVYPNEYLRKMDINEGDIIHFTPDSEYEFNIDGEKLYRVFDHQVTLNLN